MKIEQGSPEWHAQRLGKVTASRIADMMAETKTGWGAGRNNYATELIVERLTGRPADSYVSAAMQHGTDCEPQARACYTLETDINVVEVGFIDHPTIKMTGASPDGLVGDDGLIEIKCPNMATHLDTLLGAKIPDKYIKQMQWQMACTGRLWCDFFSFDPRLPLELQSKTIRVARDSALIIEIEKATKQFLKETEERYQSLMGLRL